MTAHDPRVTLTEAERDDLDDAWQEAAWSRDLHPAVEQIIAARLAPIRALADEWERTAGSDLDILDVETLVQAEHFGFRSMRRLAGRRLLAALDAPVSASQDHDGAVHNHPPYEPTCNERRVDGQLRGACLNDDGSPR